ncbi:MAG: major tail protein [Lachnospiraceae bacterium]
MANTMNELRPAMKLTVGAQYICFNKMDAKGNWTSTFEDEVIKLPTVSEVDVSDEADSHTTYASGEQYDSDTQVSAVTMKTTNVAFDDLTLDKMKGSDIDGGAVLSGGIAQRPYFAYGFVVKKKDGTKDLRWYPKCKLTDNADKTSTSADKWSDQTDDITISATGFDDKAHKCVKCLTSDESTKNITEDKFFAKPLLTAAEVKALETASTGA